MVSMNKSFQNCSVLILFLLLVVVLSGCSAIPRVKLTDNSMEPNFFEGDQFDVYEISQNDISRGDLLYFKLSFSEQYLVKRVVGLPNETIMIRDGEIYIDDILLEETYKVIPPNYEIQVQLTNDMYFLLGDNRANSMDSHNFGPISIEEIVDLAIPVK